MRIRYRRWYKEWEEIESVMDIAEEFRRANGFWFKG
jgi:hypothetical protein